MENKQVSISVFLLENKQVSKSVFLIENKHVEKIGISVFPL